MISDDDLSFDPFDDLGDAPFDAAANAVGAALEALRLESAEHGKAHLFREIKPLLTGGEGAVSWPELGRRLGISENSARVCVMRMRKRLGELVRAQIGGRSGSLG